MALVEAIPLDGQNTLLREHYKAGDIKLHQSEIEEVFWQHTRIKNFGDVTAQQKYKHEK